MVQAGPDFRDINRLFDCEKRINKRIDELEKKIFEKYKLNKDTKNKDKKDRCAVCWNYQTEIVFDAKGGNWKKCDIDTLGKTIVSLANIKKNWKDINKFDCQVEAYSINSCPECGRKEYLINVRILEF